MRAENQKKRTSSPFSLWAMPHWSFLPHWPLASPYFSTPMNQARWRCTISVRKRIHAASSRCSTVLSKLAIYRTVLDKFLGWVESLVWGKIVGRFLNSIYPVYQKRGSKSQKRFQIDSKLKASVSRRKTNSDKEKNWAGRGWGGVLIKVEEKVRRTGPHSPPVDKNLPVNFS